MVEGKPWKTRLKPLKFKEKVIHQVLEVLKCIFYVSLAIKIIMEIQHFFTWNRFSLIAYFYWFSSTVAQPFTDCYAFNFAVLETVTSFEEWDRNKDKSEKMVAKLEKQEIKFLIPCTKYLYNTPAKTYTLS